MRKNETDLQTWDIWDSNLSDVRCVKMNKTRSSGNVSVGHYPYCDWSIQLQRKKQQDGYWNVPKSSG